MKQKEKKNLLLRIRNSVFLAFNQEKIDPETGIQTNSSLKRITKIVSFLIFFFPADGEKKSLG